LKKSRSLFYALLALITVAVGIITNIATTQVPGWLQPFLWIAWPILGVLTIFFIVLTVRNTHEKDRDTQGLLEPHVEGVSEYFYQQDWNGSPDVSIFYGRRRDIGKLKRWIVDEHCRLIAILGIGGIGKSSLAKKVAEQIQAEFDYVFWRDLRNEPPLEDILRDCIKFLSNQREIDLPENIDNRILLLVKYLQEHRCLLIFDNVEAILRVSDRVGRYRAGYESYGLLIQRIGEAAHKSCLVLTSREKPKEISLLEGKTSPTRSIQLGGLGQKDGQKILSGKNLHGTDEAVARLVFHYAGNPLALKIVPATIKEQFGGDITKFLDQGATTFGEIQDLLNEQFNRLSGLEISMMYWLMINREPVSLDDLKVDIVEPVTQRELQESLGSLRERSLIETIPPHFTLQAVVLEYVTDRLIEKVCIEIDSGVIDLCRTHALIKAQAKEYIRDIQVRLILRSIVAKLLARLSQSNIESKLLGILTDIRVRSPIAPAYIGGNMINLLSCLKGELDGLDLSHLTIQQAYFQGVSMRDVNLAYSNLSRSVFTEAFGSVFSLAISPNGKVLAVGATNEIRLWQIKDSKQLMSFRGHTDYVRSIVFNSDGQILASSSEDQTVRLWDIRTGQCVKTLQGHTGRVWSIALSSDGKTLASGSEDHTIRLWDIQTGECLRTFRGHTNWVRSVAFSPDDHMLASGSVDHSIRLWDVGTGQCVNTLQGHTDWVRSVAFSPDGQVLASGSDDQAVRLWEVQTCRCIKTLQGHTSRVRSVAFASSGQVVASGSEDQSVRLWDVNTGRCLKILHGHTDWVGSVAFSPDNYILASGSNDETIKVWNMQTGECLKTLTPDRPYERMNIIGVSGLTDAQKATLMVLGAVEVSEKKMLFQHNGSNHSL